MRTPGRPGPRPTSTRCAAALITVLAVVTLGLPGYLSVTVPVPPGTTLLSDATASSQVLSFTGPLVLGEEHTPGSPPSSRLVTLPRSEPLRIQIPAIEVDSDLMDLGLRRDGSLQTPPEGFPAGWFTGAPTPGELGPAVIAGHVDWDGEAGVFYRLSDLRPGDDVLVTREDGTIAVFRVTQVEAFAKSSFPTALVYGDLPYSGLRLITCGGSFDRRTRHYVDNIVVFAELVRFSAG